MPPIPQARSFTTAFQDFIATLGSCLTLGLCESINEWAAEVDKTPSLSSTVFVDLLRVINPSVQFEVLDYLQPIVETRADGITTYEHLETPLVEFVRSKVGPIVYSLINSRNCFLREGGTRASLIVTLLAEEAAYVADYAIGLVAAAFSLLSCGVFPKVNFYAEQTLKNDTKALLVNPCEEIRAIVNPWQFLEE